MKYRRCCAVRTSVPKRHPVNVNLEYLSRRTVARRANRLRRVVRAMNFPGGLYVLLIRSAQHFRILRLHHDSP